MKILSKLVHKRITPDPIAVNVSFFVTAPITTVPKPAKSLVIAIVVFGSG
jgi:hypothetical protein